MKKFLADAPFLLLLLGAASSAHAADLSSITTTGWSLVPQACQTCACGLSGVIEILRQLINFGIGLAVLVAVFVIAYAGLLFIMSAMNPESRNQASKLLIGGFIGLVITLSAWLIVDFVMKTFYGGQFGPWNSILLGQGGDTCVQATVPKALFTGTLASNFAVPGTGSTNTTGTTNGITGGGGTGNVQYVGDAPGEVGDESGLLSGMLSCMAGKATFQVTSISDHLITSGQKTFQQCDQQGGCAHHIHSCHYGGVSCVGQSYAADIRNQSDNSPVVNAANACGATWSGQESDHLHVSIGGSCGCN